MSRNPTAAEVRAAIRAQGTAPAPAEAQTPQTPAQTVADVRAVLAGLDRGSPVEGATTENPSADTAPGTEQNSAPALPVPPAPPTGSDTLADVPETTNAAPDAGQGLPHDVPGHAALAAAGIETIDDLLAAGDLTQIDGIGPVTADRIHNWMYDWMDA